jgi:hypothetical protein
MLKDVDPNARLNANASAVEPAAIKSADLGAGAGRNAEMSKTLLVR